MYDEVNIPIVMRKQFLIPEGLVRNEYYASVKDYLSKEFPELFRNVVSYDFVKNLFNKMWDYYTTEYNIDDKNKPYIRFMMNSGNSYYTITIGYKYKYIKVPIEEFNSIFEGVNKSHRIIMEDNKEKIQVLQSNMGIAEGSIVDVKDNYVIMRVSNSKEAIVNVNMYTPLYKLPYIVHEFFHAITLTTLYNPYINLQMVTKLSTSEFLAETLTYQFMKDNVGWVNAQTVFYNLEYLIYNRDFHTREKEVRKFIRGIIEKGYITNLEILNRYYKSALGVISPLYNIINEMILSGSMLKYKPLSSIVPYDYSLIYLIFNFEMGEPLVLSKTFWNVTEQENKFVVFMNRKLTLEEFIRKFRDEYLLELFNYDPKTDTIRVKKPIECVYYKGLESILLNSKICRGDDYE